MNSKIDLFCQSWHPCFDHFGVQKVVFWTFGKLFWSWSRIVRALFLDLKGPLLGVFSARKVDIWPLNQSFGSNFGPLRGSFWPFWGPKKSFFWLFESWFGSCSEVVWASFLASKATFSTPYPFLWGPAEALPREKPFFGIFHPYEPWCLFSGWVVVVGGGAYFWVKFWLFWKLFGSCF